MHEIDDGSWFMQMQRGNGVAVLATRTLDEKRE
jgi:hypothetical protein